MGRRRIRPIPRYPRTPPAKPGEGVTPDMMMTRCVGMLSLLSRRWFGVSAQDLANELGVSRRTAYRYLAAAEDVLKLERRKIDDRILYRLTEPGKKSVDRLTATSWRG